MPKHFGELQKLGYALRKQLDPATAPPARSLAVYTHGMSRRFIALIVVLVMGLQGPFLAMAAAPGMTATGHCCPGHQSGHDDNGCPPCPAGVLVGTCSAGSPVFATSLCTHISLSLRPVSFLLSALDSVPFVTESPDPRFRPPIV
jgi:hypothetical protein